jgi:hypothetical protein
MSQTAVLVWLSASSLLPTFRADLDGFAHSRLLRFEAPRQNAAPFRSSAYAPDAVAQVESSLEEAHHATAALEPSRALAALEQADRLVREHPELPQSAWLMAEILESSADLESTTEGGTEAEQALRKRALILEGRRAAPFSDRTTPLDTEPEATRPVSVDGLEPDDSLEWDGLQSGALLTTTSGEHHARVTRNGRLLWAGWAELTASESQLRLPVPETVACSPDDIGQGALVDGRALPARHARCDSYVLARARASGGIEAALCERTSCGKVLIWDRSGVQPATTGAGKKRVWPYAVAASAGALAVAGVVLWRMGVFDRSGPGASEVWVFNGQKQMALRF